MKSVTYRRLPLKGEAYCNTLFIHNIITVFQQKSPVDKWHIYCKFIHKQNFEAGRIYGFSMAVIGLREDL
jgi:hypothetical protein